MFVIRVLIVRDYLSPTGGAEIYTDKVMEMLKNRGHTVRLVGGEKTVCSYVSRFFSFRYLNRISKILQEFNPDVILAHKFTQNLSPSFLLAADKENVPVLVKIHDLRMLKLPEFSSGNFMENLYKSLYLVKIPFQKRMYRKYVSAFIAPSRNTKEFAKRSLNIKNVYYLPNFIDWSFPSSIKRLSKDRSNENFLITYVGALVKEKGVSYLLKAAEKIISRNENIDIKLNIIGENRKRRNYPAKIRKFVKNKDLEDNIRFLGFIPHKKLPQYYFESQITVLPTIIPENSPLTILESFSQGTPVITTRLGGQAELIKNGYNGFLVNPKNSKILAEKIRFLANNKNLLNRMSKNALKTAEKFSAKNHINRLEEILRRHKR